MVMETPDKEFIIERFNQIAQMADDKKTLTGFVMTDSDAFDEIKCLARRCAEYVEKYV